MSVAAAQGKEHGINASRTKYSNGETGTAFGRRPPGEDHFRAWSEPSGIVHMASDGSLKRSDHVSAREDLSRLHSTWWCLERYRAQFPDLQFSEQAQSRNYWSAPDSAHQRVQHF